MSQIEECVTLKNVLRLEKWAIEKFVTGRKICHIWKNGSVRKMGQNGQNGPQRNLLQLEKWVKVRNAFN